MERFNKGCLICAPRIAVKPARFARASPNTGNYCVVHQLVLIRVVTSEFDVHSYSEFLWNLKPYHAPFGVFSALDRPERGVVLICDALVSLAPPEDSKEELEGMPQAPEGDISCSAWTVRRGSAHSFPSPGSKTIEGEGVGDAVKGNLIFTAFAFFWFGF